MSYANKIETAFREISEYKLYFSATCFLTNPIIDNLNAYFFNERNSNVIMSFYPKFSLT